MGVLLSAALVGHWQPETNPAPSFHPSFHLSSSFHKPTSQTYLANLPRKPTSQTYLANLTRKPTKPPFINHLSNHPTNYPANYPSQAMENVHSRYDALTNDFPPNDSPPNDSPPNDSPNDFPLNDSTGESWKPRVKVLLGPARTFERAPHRLGESWRSAQQEEGGSTARIFLDEGGFAAWFVYVLAKNASQSRAHFQGKADICQLITNLERESAASRKQLAADVRSEIPSEVRQKIDGVYEKKIKQARDINMSQTNKRRREYSAKYQLYC